MKKIHVILALMCANLAFIPPHTNAQEEERSDEAIRAELAELDTKDREAEEELRKFLSRDDLEQEAIALAIRLSRADQQSPLVISSQDNPVCSKSPNSPLPAIVEEIKENDTARLKDFELSLNDLPPYYFPTLPPSLDPPPIPSDLSFSWVWLGEENNDAGIKAADEARIQREAKREKLEEERKDIYDQLNLLNPQIDKLSDEFSRMQKELLNLQQPPQNENEGSKLNREEAMSKLNKKIIEIDTQKNDLRTQISGFDLKLNRIHEEIMGL